MAEEETLGKGTSSLDALYNITLDLNLYIITECSTEGADHAGYSHQFLVPFIHPTLWLRYRKMLKG
ncbi:hypothetical protein HKBW3S43_01505 [Candidatus Hakubella thermalkaliphila]|uniref:Uncharacterized protein n=2 Tax=Candidatus Hakubella thermalkaliphila TaxID=2754717 RepID=A0A6V8PX95_9ACTN|nr:hypothetical protein HKBW3S43_01505 [Candidatus Hakubella thermalkaliphila]